MRKSFELGYSGAITFVQDNSLLFRASLNSSNSIVVEQILSINNNTIGSAMLVDVAVTSSYIVVSFDNQTFYAFVRLSGSNPTLSKAQPSPLTESSMAVWDFSLLPSSQSTLRFYILTDNTGQPNYIYYFHVVPIITNGATTDVQFQFQSQQNINSVIGASVSLTNQYMVIGCPTCSNFQGQVIIYDLTTFTQQYSISGINPSNLELGTEVIALEFSPTYFVVLARSETSGSPYSRQFFINSIQILINNSTFQGQTTFRIVQNLVPNPQLDLRFGLFNNTLILKYQYSTAIYGLTSCNYLSYYDPSSSQCYSCVQNTSDPSLSPNFQQTQCQTCGQIWCQDYSSSPSSFQQTLYNTMCSSYDPTTYAAYNQCISTNTTGGGGSNSTNKNSTSGGGGGTQVNVAGIVAGILVPIFVIAIAIGAYFGYKKWKQRREEQQTKEEREKKQQGKDDTSRRKKASEMTESKVQKKMDKEMFEQIKQMENQDNEAGKKDGGPKDKSTEIRRIEDVRINIKEEDNPSPSIASEERFIDDQHIKRMKSQNNERQSQSQTQNMSSPYKGVMSSFHQKRQVDDDDEVIDEDDEMESDTQRS